MHKIKHLVTWIQIWPKDRSEIKWGRISPLIFYTTRVKCIEQQHKHAVRECEFESIGNNNFYDFIDVA